MNRGPSPTEIKLKSDLDRTRRELMKIRKAEIAEQAANAANAALGVHDNDANGNASNGVPGGGLDASEREELGRLRAEVEALGEAREALAHVDGMRAEIAELQGAKQRLSRLYHTQREENRRRALKLHQILENIREINAGFDLEPMLDGLAENIRSSLGFGIVLIRLREPGTRLLRAQAFAGIEPGVRSRMQREDIAVDDFMSWLRDEFKVSRSFFISHKHEFSRNLPHGHVPDLGPRSEWEWHTDDVLLVPLFNRSGELIAYFSVDDPADRLVPSREIVELLEIYANHAVVAIENSRLYQQLERHTRELEQAGQHMHELHALKSNFVSTVSHELRTPLTAIRAYTETLLNAGENGIPHQQIQRFLGVINEESQRLARLIESVLDLNRYDSGTVQSTRDKTDLRELLEETVTVLESVAQAGHVRLKLDVDCADTAIEANRDQMRQLVLHLGSNAVKFTPAGGAVSLTLSGDERTMTLTVEDTGIGIPQESLEKVFERFYQVDSSLARRYGGTGLGLSICKSIVDWHAGRITATSEPGRGSCFTVVLPRRPVPRVMVRPTPKPQAASEDVLKLAIEMVAEVMNARVVSLLTPEPDGDFVIRAAIGLSEDVVRLAHIRPGTGVAGWVAENRRPVCVTNMDSEREVAGSRRTQYRSGTFLSVPLEGERGLIGVLNVTEPMTQKCFDAEDCHLLLHLAQRVAAAWEQALTMEHSQATVGNTADALRDVLRHLEVGRRHSPNRVRLTRTVARNLGIGESDVGVISYAASVHDVGMVRLGERVVGSAGSLSQEDREEVERHPEVSAEMLEPLESVGVVRDIVLSHHEWFDGTGYPRGLKDQEIPVGGRILAVVDAFESMTIGRPHRPSMPRGEAMNEIRRLTGRQFDPAVVDAFERALNEIEAEQEYRPEPATASEHASANTRG